MRVSSTLGSPSVQKQIRKIVGFLSTAASNAGAEVGAPTFEVRGVGVTYWRDGHRFCRFDPKHQAANVGVLVVGGDRRGLKAAGLVSDRTDGVWVFVKNMRGAVRLVPEILRAYDCFDRKP